MTADQILTAIGFIGVGGLLKSVLDFFVQSKKMKHEARLAYKEVRYKAIMLLCYSLANFNQERFKLFAKRPDISSIEELRIELNVEFINMSLYGSDKVIIRFKQFIESPTNLALNQLAIAMRKDLYGIRTGLKAESFKL